MNDSGSRDDQWTIIFDGDGTLWECSKYYMEADERCLDVLPADIVTAGTTRASIVDHKRVIQQSLMKRYGYYRDVFTDSWVETYLHLCHRSDRQINERMVTDIVRNARTVQDAPYDVFPGTAETLIRLRQVGHRLHLLTRGEHDWQLDKVRRNGLAGYFLSIHPIQDTKGPQMRLLAMDAKRAMMVGDNPDDDLRPAQALGLTRVLVHNADPWVGGGKIVDPDVQVIMSVIELPALIAKLNAQPSR